MSIEIDSLEIKVQAGATDASAGINKLTAALSQLKSMTKGGAGLTAVANQISKLNTALSGITVNTGKIGEVAAALNSLSNVQKASGLTSTVNALKKIPDIAAKLETAELDKFSVQMERVANAVKPLATEMQKVSNGFSAFPIRIQKIISSNAGLAASNQKTGKSFGFLGSGISSTAARFGIYAAAFRRAASVMAGWMQESNKYVEDLNLFNVAMGEAAQSAFDYAQTVHDALGIDPAEWMRNQGVFKQITSGFGVVEDKANLMSKNLTQIGYDISSFFNISIEESMQKVQSGIAGELEPLRRLGYALDVATLQEIAYKNGIDMKVNAMTQAQKSQLRYLAIMEQSGNVMGDMARTIMTPANAMRVLNQQITQLKRALGNVLVPALMGILPYIQAFVELLTEAIQRLAVLVGFELPEIDYSGLGGISGGAEDAEDALNGAAGAAKRLKNATLGIDELNILPDQSASGGSVGGGSGDLGIELPEYDFLAGLSERTDEIKEKIKDMLGPVTGIAAGFAAWKIAKSAIGWFADLKNGKFKSIKDIANGVNKTAVGLGLMVAGFTVEWTGGFDMGYNGPNIKNVVQTAIGSALGIAGSLLVFGAGPLGWAIGIGAALTIGIASFTMGYNKRQVDDEIKRRFGEIELTAEEARAEAERLMSGPLKIQLDAYVEAKTTANQAVESYIKAVDNYSTMLWKLSVGAEVDTDELISAMDASVQAGLDSLSVSRDRYLLAINIGLSDGNVKTDMAQFAIQYFNESQDELTRLGGELKQTILDALADGVLDEPELKAIADLQSEMNQIVQKMADAEYRAKLNAVTLDASGALSYESTKAMMTELESIARERIDQLEGIRLDNLTLAELKFQEDGNKAAYDAAVAEIQKTFLEQSAELELGPAKWGLEKFNQSFSDAVAASQDAFETPVQKLIEGSLIPFGGKETDALVGTSVYDFMSNLSYNWKMEFNNLDVTPETRAALAKTLSALEPTAEQLQKIADDARSAGNKVPEEVAAALSDYNNLAAISGNVDAIDYLLGEKLSTDPNFLDALARAEDAGVSISASVANGLLDNVEIKNNADGTVSLINDTIGERVYQVTPQLTQTLKDLGVNLSDGLLGGAEAQMESNKRSWFDWAIWPWNWFKEANEIHSPSKKFSVLGGYISDGLWDGINGRKTNLFSNIGNWASGILNKVKSTLGIHSPSKVFRDEIGLNLGLGVAEGIAESTKNVITAAGILVDGVQSSIGAVEVPVAVSYHDMGGFANIPVREELVSSLNATFSSPDGNDRDDIRAGMSEQNALLRRQNEILLDLLEKSGTVYLDSRDITGRQAEVSRMYGR